MRQPWFRKQTQSWYVKDVATGRQIQLGPDKISAFAKWHAMQRVAPPDAPDAPLVSLINAFLVWSDSNQKPSTYQYHRAYLDPFCVDCGHLATNEFKAYHLTAWLDERKYTRGARSGAIANVKAMLNWCVQQGLIDSNPVAHVRKPPKRRREKTVDAGERTKILDKTDAPFRLFVIALSHLGCRPQEVRTVDAAKFDERLGAWVFPPEEHKTGQKTGKRRVVHLTPCIATLSRILAASRPQGALFLNSRGEPWTHGAVRSRMARMRKAGIATAGVVAYSFRHTFATNALLNGVGVATLAEVMGHGDTAMIDRHYGHLTGQTQHLRDAVNAAQQTRITQ